MGKQLEEIKKQLNLINHNIALLYYVDDGKLDMTDKGRLFVKRNKPAPEPKCSCICDIKGCYDIASVKYHGIKYCQKHSLPVPKHIRAACVYPIRPGEDDCPEHGEKESWNNPFCMGARTGKTTATEHWLKDHMEAFEKYMRFIKDPDPAPPLRVQVAEALGKVVERVTGVDKMYWGVQDSMPRWNPVPPYDTDIKLATGAFWTYLLKIGSNDFCISRVHIRIQEIVTVYNGIFPEAEDFCLAIVKHKERK